MSVKFLTDKDEKKFVKTVNGVAPDEKGNVSVQGGGGSGGSGADGFSPVANVTQTASGAVISITDKSGTTTATIVNGMDGYTPQKGVDYFDGEPGKDGSPGDDGYTPVKGKDYFDGKDGQDGTSATHSWNGTILTITSASGTSSADLKGDKGDSIKGDAGSRGPGILKVSTSPSSYTTATGGQTPTKRMSLSTIKSEASVSEVMAGDIISYSYYLYPIYYVDSTYAYTKSGTSIRGATGAAGAAGAAGKDGSDATVTAANIASALGYTPADEADVAVLLDALDTVQTVIPSININDGVYEYGRFATAGTEWDKDTPITGAFRNANYLPVTGGRTMAIYFDAYEWNNNNKGHSVEIVEYDSDKNIVGARRAVTTYTASREGFALDASTAYVRLCINRSGTSIATPLDEIEMALYYIEDAQLSYVSYEPTIVEETVLNTEAVSVLRGKKIVYDGDSICESRTSGTAANGGGYAKLIADKVNGIYTNQAVGGARLCAHSEKHSVVNNLANLPTDGDLYCFQGGINDFWGDTAIGTCSATDYTGTLDTSTICGALETIFRYCLTNFLGKPICFVITHKVQNTGHTANSDGKTFKNYRDAMVQVCEKYSIPYYDAFAESGLNGWNTAQSNAFLTANSSGAGDGTHPNEEGYKRYYVPQLISLFEKIFPAQ